MILGFDIFPRFTGKILGSPLTIFKLQFFLHDHNIYFSDKLSKNYILGISIILTEMTETTTYLQPPEIDLANNLAHLFRHASEITKELKGK